ncbi:hypothetical protein CGGC5_v013797 [Colletotrichum fructicola Nara gc5]|uniref:Uncharacterized protein n=1 Tax=Colletotrichum fructicola (strain Nara gc5) TaxID=1213859 RepID=A0A7J6ING7_COLFN|nr:hypothetical protein CGGC5_v013797 [Colletotrichum fructicola Nara gc5]
MYLGKNLFLRSQSLKPLSPTSPPPIEALSLPVLRSQFFFDRGNPRTTCFLPLEPTHQIPLTSTQQSLTRKSRPVHDVNRHHYLR